MNEIKRMYESAGIKKQRECECNEHCAYYSVVSCEECDVETDMVYPPFTAEKQLNIIKGFAQGYPLGFAYGCYETYSFEEGLAKCIDDIWKDLSEEDKQQVKEILE